jgi:hypothetical protein
MPFCFCRGCSCIKTELSIYFESNLFSRRDTLALPRDTSQRQDHHPHPTLHQLINGRGSHAHDQMEKSFLLTHPNDIYSLTMGLCSAVSG